MLHTAKEAQPIDGVKRGIEKALPVLYFFGIIAVYVSSAAVMCLLLYPPFFAVIGSPSGAGIAAVAVPLGVQLMRFLIIFTDSLTAGRNDSKGLVHIVSFAMLVISIVEVWQAVWAIGASSAIAISVSSLMLAGCVLELSFVRKLNRRDEETEAEAEAVKNGNRAVVPA